MAYLLDSITSRDEFYQLKTYLSMFRKMLMLVEMSIIDHQLWMTLIALCRLHEIPKAFLDLADGVVKTCVEYNSDLEGVLVVTTSIKLQKHLLVCV